MKLIRFNSTFPPTSEEEVGAEFRGRNPFKLSYSPSFSLHPALYYPHLGWASPYTLLYFAHFNRHDDDRDRDRGSKWKRMGMTMFPPNSGSHFSSPLNCGWRTRFTPHCKQPYAIYTVDGAYSGLWVIPSRFGCWQPMQTMCV